MGMVRRTCSWLALLCLAGAALAAAPPAQWLDVPFVKQPPEGCGAAVTAMVMQYWLQQQGRTATGSADVAGIQRALYSRRAHGIYASDLAWYFQVNGFRTFQFRGQWLDLKHHLDQGRPLIVALQPRHGALLHYVVVAGLEQDPDVVLLNDPATRKLLKQDRLTFEKQWTAADDWTLLALPADR
jgi:ABC-type bacteriocin/lantibiotic exporter with double-glycine peptidase domain